MAKRANIAAALVQYATGWGRRDVSKCLTVIATSLERDGDVEGAALVRAIPPQPVRGVTFNARDEDRLLRWHVPSGDVEMPVFDDFTELDRLALHLSHVERFLAKGVDAPTRAMFAGPSGTGKTLAARWLGWKLGLPVAIVELDRVVGSHLGETARAFRTIFERATDAPCVLVLDELDGCCVARSSPRQDVGEMARVTSSLIQQIDALPPRQIVIAATNLPDMLDEAIVRRLPTRIDFPMPSVGARARMVAHWLRGVGADVDPKVLGQLVVDYDGRSGADLRAAAMDIGRCAILGGGREQRAETEAAQ